MLESARTVHRVFERQPILEEIAASLGCSVADFSEPTSSNLNQTGELLGMWLMIDNEQDRLKVLSLMRSIAPTATTQQQSSVRKPRR